MLGSAVVSLPWAYQQAGLILGTFISFTSFIVSYYTCYLIMYTARKDTDFFDTVRRYYGKYNNCKVRNHCVINVNRYLGILYWHDHVNRFIIRLSVSILRNPGIAPVPNHPSHLCVGLRLQTGLPFRIHAQPILAKLLRLNAIRSFGFHLYQERPWYFHESGLNRRHICVHADHFHRSDRNKGLHEYRVFDRYC